MKRNSALPASAALVLFLSGCATTGPATYEPAKSRAYNLAQAAGISDARDIERKHLSENELYRVASNADLLTWDRGANWSVGEALGASLLLSALEPTSNFAKDSLFGWMPADMAVDSEQARQKMSEAAVSAVKKSLEGLGYSYQATLENHDQKALFGGGSAFLFSQMTIIDADIGCPAPDSVDHYSKTCYVSSKIIEPSQEVTPEFLGAGKTWAFGTEGRRESWIKVMAPEGVTLDRLSIIGRVSENLPTWAYLFLPPSEESPPVVLHEGAPLYFVEPAPSNSDA